METIAICLCTLTASFLCFFFIFRFFSFQWRRQDLPPFAGASLPLVGHLHVMKSPPHRTLQSLSNKYGPIFSLQLGSRLVVVVSSPALAEECFTKNDIILANRPPTLVSKHIGYNDSVMIVASYGDHWRNLRRLAAQEIFSPNRLNLFISIRQDEIKRLVRNLGRNSSKDFAKVELRSKISELTFNVMMRTIAGKRYFGEDEDYNSESKNFQQLIKEVAKHAETSNPEDFLPFLKWIDYRGLDKTLAEVGAKMDAFYQALIDEHRHDQQRNTMIGHLLSLQQSQPEYYTDLTIKGLIMVMLTAGTDTSAVTIEWALSLLLNHPQVLKKAREEMDAVVGCDRLVEESDLPNLRFLQHIISETFRLFPAAPLLVPHESAEDCWVGGYVVPRGTILLVNAWAIHRDPKVWEDAHAFRPERFDAGGVETNKLMPFGLGRRSCPGYGLGQRMVGLALASLIQCFEWERISEEEVDLTEGKGLTMPKAVPLEAMCKARDIMNKNSINLP